LQPCLRPAFTQAFYIGSRARERFTFSVKQGIANLPRTPKAWQGIGDPEPDGNASERTLR
ncbi:hypothetical protein, partial [Lentibacter algarum]|uniref:hypothetical protein n=1 Tax=Lentibacter algarum TaxID=576131 RepID=UPI003BAFAD40